MIVRWIWRAAWLLLPAAWLAHRLAHSPALTFFLCCASLVPLAKTMGDATEALAARMGPAAGSLLNASFGNAARASFSVNGLRFPSLSTRCSSRSVRASASHAPRPVIVASRYPRRIASA